MDNEYDHDSTRIMSVGWVNALSVYTLYRQLQRFHITLLTFMYHIYGLDDEYMEETHFYVRIEAMQTPMRTLLSGVDSSELSGLHSFVFMCLNLILYSPIFLWIEITRDVTPNLLLHVCILHVVSSTYIYKNIYMLRCEKKRTDEKKSANPDKTVPDEIVLSGLAAFTTRCHAICFNFVYGNRIKQNKTVTNPEKMTLYIRRLVGTGKVYT